MTAISQAMCRAEWFAVRLDDARRCGNSALARDILQDAVREDLAMDFELQRAIDVANDEIAKRRARRSRLLRFH